jgi:pyruvate/2-oxoglutarate dehydrogenase complex dihydrolipoamide acyltransferase (E2) component
LSTKPDTTTAITLPETKEIAKLPRFTTAVVELNKLVAELEKIEAEGKELKIVDRVTFDRADTLNKRRKEIVKEAEKLVDPYKSPLRKWLDFVQQHFNIVKNRAEQGENYFTPKMKAYVEEDNRKRQAEKDRLQREENERNAKAANELKKEELARAAEEKASKIQQLKAALKAGDITKAQYTKALKEAGAEQEAAIAQAELDAETAKANPPQVEVEPSVRQGRTYYHAECTDRDLFLRDIVKRIKNGESDLFRFIMPDNSELNKYAGERKNTAATRASFAGIKAWEDKSF